MATQTRSARGMTNAVGNGHACAWGSRANSVLWGMLAPGPAVTGAFVEALWVNAKHNDMRRILLGELVIPTTKARDGEIPATETNGFEGSSASSLADLHALFNE